jgi:hypothetical protein
MRGRSLMMLQSGSARPEPWAGATQASQALTADRIDVDIGIDSVSALLAGDGIGVNRFVGGCIDGAQRRRVDGRQGADDWIEPAIDFRFPGVSGAVAKWRLVADVVRTSSSIISLRRSHWEWRPSWRPCTRDKSRRAP